MFQTRQIAKLFFCQFCCGSDITEFTVLYVIGTDVDFRVKDGPDDTGGWFNALYNADQMFSVDDGVIDFHTVGGTFSNHE
ncbi:hypothetical protein SDC9_183040 [bioreactor metagenome]|uniref:Uncharacterized protein n=1 Tax=bioreactor metagenome TaxID=1076179 RepID=A0A645HB03_9ZZZZ